MRRRRFWPALLLTIILWAGWFYIFIKLPPENILFIALFLFLLLWALGFLFSLIFKSKTQGFLFAATVIIFLLLRLLGMAHIVNLVLLFALFLTLELYLHR